MTPSLWGSQFVTVSSNRHMMLVWLQSKCSASSVSRLACGKVAQRLVSVARHLKWLSCKTC